MSPSLKMKANQANQPLLGAHMSIEGGLHKAIDRGMELGLNVIQIFTQNASRWKGKTLTKDIVDAFVHAKEDSGILVYSHGSYLINLASVSRDLIHKSVRGLVTELERCETLGVPAVVTHPGSAKGSDEKTGLETISFSLNQALESTMGCNVRILLENTAGQGSALGYEFSHLIRMIDNCRFPDRLGVCLDTCHAFAAGYDLRTIDTCEEVISDFDRIVGLDKLELIHLNDCKKELGRRVDRHEHIGMGKIGPECFKYFMTSGRFANIPKIIETPKKQGDMDMDPVNLKLLRSFVS